MMGLSDDRKSFPIGLAVLIQYRSVTASDPATQPPSHVAVAITLYAKASSLKMIMWYCRVYITRSLQMCEDTIILFISLWQKTNKLQLVLINVLIRSIYSSVVYLSMLYTVLFFIRAPFYVLLVFIVMCSVFKLLYWVRQSKLAP